MLQRPLTREAAPLRSLTRPVCVRVHADAADRRAGPAGAGVSGRGAAGSGQPRPQRAPSRRPRAAGPLDLPPELAVSSGGCECVAGGRRAGPWRSSKLEGGRAARGSESTQPGPAAA
eukprot:937042-Rhodomonas_salina.1